MPQKVPLALPLPPKKSCELPPTFAHSERVGGSEEGRGGVSPEWEDILAQPLLKGCS